MTACSSREGLPALSDVGIWAYAGVNELANTAPHTGSPVETTLSVLAVANSAGEGAREASGAATYALPLHEPYSVGAAESTVLSLAAGSDTTAVQLLASHTRGGDGTKVDAVSSCGTNGISNVVVSDE